MEKNGDVYEIDIFHILRLLFDKWVTILLTTVVSGIIALLISRFMISPLYSSSALLYVNNNSFSLGSGDFSISTGEISAAKSLVSTYEVILKTRNTLNSVIERAHLSYSYEQLSSMITSSAVNNTEIFSVNVTCNDPNEAELIANTIADVLPGKISDIVERSNVSIVDRAVVSTSRVSPSYTKNTLIGLLIGFVLSCGLIVLLDFLDDIVHNEEYLTNNFDYPVLTSIPDTYTGQRSDKHKYGYGYGKGYRYGYKYSYKYGYDYSTAAKDSEDNKSTTISKDNIKTKDDPSKNTKQKNRRGKQ